MSRLRAWSELQIQSGLSVSDTDATANITAEVKADFGSLLVGQSGSDFASLAGTASDLLLSGTSAPVNNSLAALQYSSPTTGTGYIHFTAHDTSGGAGQTLASMFTVYSHG